MSSTPSDAMHCNGGPAEAGEAEPERTPPLWESGTVVLEWGLTMRQPPGQAITTGYAWMVNIESDDDPDDDPYFRTTVAGVQLAQTWAAQIVYASTDLAVVGWQEVHAIMAGGAGPKYVADLVRRVHHITVEADALGFLGAYEVTPREARKLRRQMRRGGLLTLDEPRPDTPGWVRRRRYLPAGQVSMIEVVEHRAVSAAALQEEYRI